MKAIGMIETRGLVSAIESADAMLKAAEVTLIERRFVKGGLVTIVIAGDVAACKASVDAAASAVQRIGGTIVSTHVIPRPHSSLSGLIVNRIPGDGDEMRADDDEESHISSEHVDNENGGGSSQPEVEEVVAEEPEVTEEPEEAEAVEEAVVVEETVEAEPEVKAVVEVPAELTREALDKIVEANGVEVVKDVLSKVKVVALRALAREYNGEFPIAGREITHANKGNLIEQFEKYYKK